MKRFIMIVLVGFMAGCASSNSRSSRQQADSAIGQNRSGLAGKYASKIPDHVIALELRPDGTYNLCMEGWAGERTDENGVWESLANEVALHSIKDQIAAQIRRFRLGRANDGHELLFILDDHNNILWSDLSLRRE